MGYTLRYNLVKIQTLIKMCKTLLMIDLVNDQGNITLFPINTQTETETFLQTTYIVYFYW